MDVLLENIRDFPYVELDDKLMEEAENVGINQTIILLTSALLESYDVFFDFDVSILKRKFLSISNMFGRLNLSALIFILTGEQRYLDFVNQGLSIQEGDIAQTAQDCLDLIDEFIEACE